mgnify:CR=1 FL=1
MSIQCLKMAWESIKSNKMRSFLTMLGIIIGVTALVTLVSLVNGATGAITSQVEALGNDMLMVTVMDDKSAPLRLENLEEISSSFEGVEQAFAVQAGREVRVMVKPEEVTEDNMILLAHDLAKKIESELEYPGQIKVNVIRETKAVEYAK